MIPLAARTNFADAFPPSKTFVTADVAVMPVPPPAEAALCTSIAGAIDSATALTPTIMRDKCREVMGPPTIESAYEYAVVGHQRHIVEAILQLRTDITVLRAGRRSHWGPKSFADYED
jgi:hypothetical protein